MTTRFPQNLADALEAAARAVPDATQGLPDPVFQFALKITPMINVDLLVRNDQGEHLLAWREDPYGQGWHIPGGIIRFNEPIAARIAAVAKEELFATVRHEEMPCDVRQFFHLRGHFISLLYRCELASPVSAGAAWWHSPARPTPGNLAWIRGMPQHIYSVHQGYRAWLDAGEA
jgi:ADP-ribose pyrophosphatase YjhB (NUDIX family)